LTLRSLATPRKRARATNGAGDGCDVPPAEPAEVSDGGDQLPEWLAASWLAFPNPTCAGLGHADLVGVLSEQDALARPEVGLRGSRIVVRFALRAATADDAASAARAVITSAVEQLCPPALWVPAALTVSARPLGAVAATDS
jgi:hypothetical protein